MNADMLDVAAMTATLAEASPDDDRAAAIRREHEAAQRSMSDAVAHAFRCGELLIEAKAALSHGEFGAWLAANVEFSERTAQGYMRLARLDVEKRNAVADLSLREAMVAIADRMEGARVVYKTTETPPVTVRVVYEKPDAPVTIDNETGSVTPVPIRPTTPDKRAIFAAPSIIDDQITRVSDADLFAIAAAAIDEILARGIYLRRKDHFWLSDWTAYLKRSARRLRKASERAAA